MVTAEASSSQQQPAASSSQQQPAAASSQQPAAASSSQQPAASYINSGSKNEALWLLDRPAFWGIGCLRFFRFLNANREMFFSDFIFPGVTTFEEDITSSTIRTFPRASLATSSSFSTFGRDTPSRSRFVEKTGKTSRTRSLTHGRSGWKLIERTAASR